MTLRAIAAVSALISAIVHLRMWFDGVREQEVIGPAFMVNAVAGAVIAVLLLTWRHWVPLFLVAGFGASTLGAFITSTTVGLFGIHATWEGFNVWVSAVTEVLVIVVGLWALQREGWVASLRQSQD